MGVCAATHGEARSLAREPEKRDDSSENTKKAGEEGMKRFRTLF